MDEQDLKRKCVKLPSSSDLLDNINLIIFNENWDYFFLWNKYQIFFSRFFLNTYYEEIEINFQIVQLFSSKNYLSCLDTTGVVHITRIINNSKLDVMSALSFKPIEQNVIFMSQDARFTYVLTIKNKKCYLLIYKLEDFKKKKCFEIIINDINFMSEPNYNRCKMHCCLISDTEIIVFISFNGFSVYYVIINYSITSSNCFEARRLINCPSEISDIHYSNNSILLSLSIGTVLMMHWNANRFTGPQIMHLNTAIHKIVLLNESLIYSDGQSMWRADNLFTENITFRQIFVKQVKDFVLHNNKIFCSTYGKFIYKFLIDDNTIYKEPISIVEYGLERKLQKDKDCMLNIITEIEKNDEITKKIKIEENYISTLALSNRQDIVNDIINYEFEICEQFQDILKNWNVTLTNDIKDYYDLDLYYLLIKLTITSIHKKITDVLSSLIGNLEMHITILTSDKVIKTVTLQILDQLKSMNIVIPLQTDLLNNPKLTIIIELVVKIPGALDMKQMLWVKLHTQEALLNAECFIRTIIPATNVSYLKKTSDINHLIYENAMKYHGNLVKLINMNKKSSLKWKFFITLPKNYKEMLTNEECYKHLNLRLRKLLMMELSSDRFLTSRNTILLNISNEKVEIDLNTGFPDDILQTTSVNLQIASDMRNFLSHILFVNQETTEDFVSDTILDTIKDLKHQIAECVLHSQHVDKFLKIHEHFQKNVINRLNV